MAVKVEWFVVLCYNIICDSKQ